MSDEKAQLLEQYFSLRPRLIAFAARIVRDPEVAEDLVQDLYIKLKNRAGSVPVANKDAYLMQATHRMCLDYIRSKTRAEARDTAWSGPMVATLDGDRMDDTPDQERVLAGRQRLRAAEAAINDLPERCREVFVAQRVEGLSQAEVAEKLGISRKGVEKQMSRALRHLVKFVKGED